MTVWGEGGKAVKVELSRGTLARLRQMAEERDSTVETVLQEIVEDLLKPPAAIYQMKVTLRGSKPPIWRRIQVPGDVTLADLHHILQAVMDWWDSHLHHFKVGDTFIGVPHLEYMFDTLDERQVRLSEIAGEGARFVYEYDFGDSWEHVLQVEKVLEPEPGKEYPVCLKGRRAAPPEDSGGIWNYNYYAEAMTNPEHPDYPGDDDFLEWVGPEFDPAAFDLDGVNAELRRLWRELR